jgi:hypothetical protein
MCPNFLKIGEIMPKVTFNDSKGVVTEAGAGVFLEDSGIALAGKKTGLLKVEWTTDQAANTEFDTGVSFPTGDVLVNAISVYVYNVGTTLDVGLNTATDGLINGFFDGLDISATGVYGPTTTDAIRGGYANNTGDGFATGWVIPTGVVDREIALTPDPGAGATSAGKIVFEYVKLS